MSTNRTILLLEDQAILAWEMEETLRQAEIGEAVCIPSCSQAVAWLSENTPDVAVLDVHLQDGDSAEVAEALLERGVPFVVHSAYSGEAGSIPRVFRRGTWVPKLSDPHDLLRAVTSCLSSRTILDGVVSKAAEPVTR